MGSPLNLAPSGRHVPVLLAEVLAALAPADGEVFVDGTFGAGGYTRAILAAAATRVYAVDRDPAALAAGAALAAAAAGRLTLIEGRFGDIDRLLGEHGAAAVDGVTLDVGVSSMQIDEPERGFSFTRDGPLDMRMEQAGPTAADLVNGLDEGDLKRVIAVLGEERRAHAIARAIARRRAVEPFTRTLDLARLIEQVIGRPPHPGAIHPATRTFQALRIQVNDELGELALALAAAERILKPGGRLAVVSFHSLEDRIVKRFLASRCGRVAGPSRHAPAAAAGPAPSFEDIARGGITPGREEIAANPRARSARLRAARRTAAPAHRFDIAGIAAEVI